MGFDIEGVTSKNYLTSMDNYVYKVYAKLYAMVGLHRYNLYHGTNFELLEIKKFNKTSRLTASLFLTLDARDPSSGTSMTFQVRVDEQRICRLHLKCTIARPQVTTKTPAKERRKPFLDMVDKAVDGFYRHDRQSSEWPPSDDAFNDSERFYVLNDSELQHNDWIRLYVQLAISVKFKTNSLDDVSHLEIVKAVIETKEPMEPSCERLNAKCAIVYIRFKNLAKARSGDEPENCIAIVSRFFNKVSGAFTLSGDFWSEEKASNTKKRSANVSPNRCTKTKHTKTDACQNVNQTDQHNDHLEKGVIRRHSTRTRKPVQRLLS